MGWFGLDSFGRKMETRAGFCVHGNKPSGSMNFWEILEEVSAWRPLKEDWWIVLVTQSVSQAVSQIPLLVCRRWLNMSLYAPLVLGPTHPSV